MYGTRVIDARGRAAAFASIGLALTLGGCPTSTTVPDTGEDLDAGEVHPPYADATWALRCDSVMGMCSPPPARSVFGENVMGNTVACQVIEAADARTLSMTVGGLAGSERYQVQIAGARVPRGGGAAAGGTCSVVVTEGGNRYAAPCGGSPPSTEQPCQVMVHFDYDETVMSPTASALILCDHMPHESSSGQLRGLGAPTASAMPAEFLFYYCDGLTRD